MDDKLTGFLCYDFEVFKQNWLVVIKDLVTEEVTKIFDNAEALKDFYEKHKYYIWVGFNSRSYDSNILKAIICGFNPYDMNDWIINKNRKGWEFSDQLKNIQLYDYDCYLENGGSLKRLEAYLGLDIHETTVPFDIDRKLTPQEILDTFKYCEWDVHCTEEVFCRRKGEFDTMWGLIKMFNMPVKYISKTKVQLVSEILEAKKQNFNDEWDFDIEPCIDIKRYTNVLDWFKNPENRNKDAKYNFETKDCKCTIAWGGIHGECGKYFVDKVKGYCCDISSMYPASMINHDMLSRAISDKNKFVEIRDKRLEYKKMKSPLANVLKPCINGIYGAMGFDYSNLVDKRNMRRVCCLGQLALTELIERVEDYCYITNINTDGIYFEVNNDEDFEKIKNISSEWEKDTMYDLEWEPYSALYQANVNNYILVHPDGSIKCKGAMVKYNSPLDNDCSIINDAIRSYFVEKKTPEETIYSCDELIKFQKIFHVSSLYKQALKNCTFRKESYIKEETGRKNTRVVWNGDGIIFNERTFRVFASTDDNEGMLFKKKDNKNPEKFANCPDHCIIINEDIRDKKCSDIPDLDKQWYVDETYKRINLFENG